MPHWRRRSMMKSAVLGMIAPSGRPADLSLSTSASVCTVYPLLCRSNGTDAVGALGSVESSGPRYDGRVAPARIALA